MVIDIDNFINEKAQELSDWIDNPKCQYAVWEGYWAARELWPNFSSVTHKAIEQRLNDLEFDKSYNWFNKK